MGIGGGVLLVSRGVLRRGYGVVRAEVCRLRMIPPAAAAVSGAAASIDKRWAVASGKRVARIRVHFPDATGQDWVCGGALCPGSEVVSLLLAGQHQLQMDVMSVVDVPVFIGGADAELNQSANEQ